MPRRKMRPRQVAGIKLVPIYDPNKNVPEAWQRCLRNNDLVVCLLMGRPLGLDGSFAFSSEEEAREAWEHNRAVIMAQKGVGWGLGDPARGEQPEGYTVGNRPWALHFFELRTPFGCKWLRHFDPDEFAYLKEHDLLEPGEEELVEKYLARMQEGYPKSPDMYIERADPTRVCDWPRHVRVHI
jgi:hypothetical protein